MDRNTRFLIAFVFETYYHLSENLKETAGKGADRMCFFWQEGNMKLVELTQGQYERYFDQSPYANFWQSVEMANMRGGGGLTLGT